MEEKNVDLLSDKDTDGETDNEIAATESIIPKEVDKALDSIPDKAQAQVVRSIMSMQFGAISATPESAIS